MNTKSDIFIKIKETVHSVVPDAVIILYGSYARGDYRKDSDMDLLILVDNENVSFDFEKKVKYPLYDIEFDTGQTISPLVISKQIWEAKHKITPFYENVKKEGIVL